MTTEIDHSTAQNAVISLKAMEVIVAAALLAFGVLIAGASYKLGASWADDGPEAGYFPFYVGMLVAVSSLVTMLQALLGSKAGTGGAFVERGQLKLVLAILLPALIYALCIQGFGIYLASALYIVIFMVWLGKYAWWKAVTVGVGVSALMFVVFEIWFQVPLFKGDWYDPLSFLGY